MMIVEGQRVIYAGDTDPFQEVGAPGKVVALSGEAAHVQWLAGPKQGSLELVALHELVGDRQQAEAILGALPGGYTASLSTTAATQVRAAYDEAGEEGVLNVLSEAGHLAVFAERAEQALWNLIGTIGSEASMKEALAQLEADERDTVVSRVAASLLANLMAEA